MKRVAYALIFAAIAAVLLEAGLQVASLVAYLTHSRDEVTPGAEGGGTILCLGDSYTYGVGASASDNTYPSVMRRRLKDQRGAAPTVINAGWPSRNSRDLLAKLDGQLQRFDPDLVFILIGLNDTWSRPKRLDLADASPTPGEDSGWRLRWRTGRLLAWAFGDYGGSLETETAIRGASAPPPKKAGTSAGDPFSRGVSCLSTGDPQGAALAFEEALQAQPARAAEIRQGLVQSYSILGMEDKARASLDRLEEEHVRRPTLQTTEALVAALAVLRENAKAFEIAQTGVRDFPNSSELWWSIGGEHYRTGRLPQAEKAYDEALNHADPDNAAWRALLMRECARTCVERDPKKSLRLVISSLLLDGDFGRCLVALRPGRPYYSRELADEAVAEMELRSTDKDSVTRLLATLFSMKDEATAPDALGVLEPHLRQMISRCVAHGSQPVLMTYPMSVPHVEVVARKLAGETAAELVDVRRRFEVESRNRPREELFIPDGHCADGGYLIMGQLAEAAARRILTSDQPDGAARP